MKMNEKQFNLFAILFSAAVMLIIVLKGCVQ